MGNSNKRARYASFIICTLLVLTTLCAFWQVKDHAFLKFDDHLYITENPAVQAGLTWQGLKWAFTTTTGALWNPLVWLSFMLDYQLFGLNTGGFHLINLFFHLANTLLLFLVFRRMTGTLWRSAFVAALFALHPLHVESVAWATERKDVLSAFFWMLTMWAYIRYAESPGLKKYWPVLVFFGMGLMAKPMLVTLPFVLLLLDYWPLGRLQRGRALENSHGRSHNNQRSYLFLLLEKIPLFILTAILSFVTFFATKKMYVSPFVELPSLLERAMTALIGYVFYMWKMIWPFNLAVFYPRPTSFPAWQVAGACLLLAGISILAIREMRNRPYLLVGWLWFLGTLVPVMGLIVWTFPSVGFIGADRYTYVPLIGLFIMIAWGVPDLFPVWRYKKTALAVAAGLLIFILMILTWAQVRYWQNGIALFTHTLKVTNNNWVAHYNLGVELAHQEKVDEAISHFTEALRINPNYAQAHYNLGNALFSQGEMNEAVSRFKEALRINPQDAMVHNNLGVALVRQGRVDEAVFHFKEALRIDPHHEKARRNLERALILQ